MHNDSFCVFFCCDYNCILITYLLKIEIFLLTHLFIYYKKNTEIMPCDRNPHWYSVVSKAFTTFSQRGIPSTFSRAPGYIYLNIFKNWCEQNDINFYKRKGKRTRKRIMKKFTKYMKVSPTGEVPSIKYYENKKMKKKIYGILDYYYNYEVDLTVTLLNGDQYKDKIVGNIKMHELFSKIEKNINIPDNAIYYIIDGLNNEWYPMSHDCSIYINPKCELITYIMTYCCPNYYELNLGVIV